MRPRLTLPAFVFTFAVLAMLAVAVAGFFAVAFYQMTGATMIGILALIARGPLLAASSVIVMSALCSAAAWAAMFALQRDGTHRLEAATAPRRAPSDLEF